MHDRRMLAIPMNDRSAPDIQANSLRRQSVRNIADRIDRESDNDRLHHDMLDEIRADTNIRVVDNRIDRPYEIVSHAKCASRARSVHVDVVYNPEHNQSIITSLSQIPWANYAVFVAIVDLLPYRAVFSSTSPYWSSQNDVDFAVVVWHYKTLHDVAYVSAVVGVLCAVLVSLRQSAVHDYR